MSRKVVSTPQSWQTAAGSFDDASIHATRALEDLLTQTTDPGACNAANGLATIDGAVAIMLSAFGSVMRESVLNPLAGGLAEEAQAMTATGVSLQQMEDHAVDVAREIWH